MFIELTRGKETWIDDEDLGLTAKFKWCAIYNHGNWYAITNIPHPKFKGRFLSLQLHRLLLGIGYGDPQKVDHIDGDSLNNRRSNLRLATTLENNWNRGPIEGSTSQYKGVSWHRFKSGRGKWRAQVIIHGEKHRLGLFEEEEEAARVCDAFYVEMCGEFARLNFPQDQGSRT